MELLIVHLTDIHVRDDNDFDVLLDRTNSVGGVICNHITDSDNTAVLLCVTGDFAFSGQENQYSVVDLIIEEICNIIKKRLVKLVLI